ncbi:helix-hairpin-helix domain-containing protein [Agarilytica rhodophyticola]|uniref:helix-hairpin-helix domain-containing protein n=1 Tax=Agarilytica rhodophyticola TaxID=1737490 RepID=UPI000B343FE2|nr:helix-hairpin-helix domain-containing protein [Agarilytica rhodophyticola]
MTAKLYISTNTSHSRSELGLASQSDRAKSAHQDKCGLDCLQRPKFFAGQLLGENDLNALLSWAQSKFKLGRFDAGWGIACGLHLQCADAQHPDIKQKGATSTTLTLHPGYAVDSSGNDLLVCAPYEFDLSDVCQPSQGRCADIVVPPEDEHAEFLGLALSDGELVAVDVFIHYQEEPAQALPALGRGTCAEHDACEYSRVNETVTVEWRYAKTSAQPDIRQLSDWERLYYAKSRSVVDAYIERFGGLLGQNLAQNLSVIRCWLLDWIEREGIYHACFLPDAIAQLSVDNQLERDITRILFWLMVDARLAHLAGGCPANSSVSGPASGVPVGRVWLRQSRASNNRCEIAYIDTSLAHRRDLRLDKFPAEYNQFNLGQFVFEPADWVNAQVKDLGLEAQYNLISIPSRVQDLQYQLDLEAEPQLMINLGLSTHIQISVVNDAVLGDRVLSFNWPRTGGVSVYSVEPDADLLARADADQEQVDPLTTINGIGDERAHKLMQAGIRTYAKLAECQTEDLRRLIPRVGNSELDNWREQARKLSAKRASDAS